VGRSHTRRGDEIYSLALGTGASKQFFANLPQFPNIPNQIVKAGVLLADKTLVARPEPRFYRIYPRKSKFDFSEVLFDR
jgi:hypothetical protein